MKTTERKREPRFEGQDFRLFLQHEQGDRTVIKFYVSLVEGCGTGHGWEQTFSITTSNDDKHVVGLKVTEEGAVSVNDGTLVAPHYVDKSVTYTDLDCGTSE